MKDVMVGISRYRQQVRPGAGAKCLVPAQDLPPAKILARIQLRTTTHVCAPIGRIIDSFNPVPSPLMAMKTENKMREGPLASTTESVRRCSKEELRRSVLPVRILFSTISPHPACHYQAPKALTAGRPARVRLSLLATNPGVIAAPSKSRKHS